MCDSIFKQLHQKGIGADIKQTAVLSQEQENQLWEKRIFDLNTPVGLLRAIFFYNGKNFCSRGGQEQRNLKLSQFKRKTSVVNGKELASYTYIGSKNRQGGFSFLNQHNKIVQHYQGNSPERCHVAIMDKYLSL